MYTLINYSTVGAFDLPTQITIKLYIKFGFPLAANLSFRTLKIYKMIVLCAVLFLLCMWMWTLALFHTVMFMGETLPNNSYVDVSLVGDPLSGGEGVQCHTDLTTCCSRHQGNDSGDWYAPDSAIRLPFQQSGNLSAASERRGNQTASYLVS